MLGPPYVYESSPSRKATEIRTQKITRAQQDGQPEPFEHSGSWGAMAVPMAALLLTLLDGA
jgi:hypothetical protein